LLGAAGTYCVWTGISTIIVAINLSKHGIRTNAAVLNVVEEINDCEGCPSPHIIRTYYVEYSFITNTGRLVESSQDYSSYPEADHLPVIYNPAEPLQNFLVEDDLPQWRNAVAKAVFPLLGGSFLAGAAIYCARLGVDRIRLKPLDGM
jgi:hypothetical protein